MSPQLDGMGGVYCENCDVAGLMPEKVGAMNIGDSTRMVGVMPYAIDSNSADRLWNLSEHLTSAYFIGGQQS